MTRAERKAKRMEKTKRPVVLDSLEASGRDDAIDKILADEACARADAWARSVDGTPYGCVDINGFEEPR